MLELPPLEVIPLPSLSPQSAYFVITITFQGQEVVQVPWVQAMEAGAG